MREQTYQQSQAIDRGRRRRWIPAIPAMLIAVAVLLIVAGCGGDGDEEGAGTEGAGAGQEGEPITLTVGYQPYYTESWSGVVMRGKELWKKHLPEGSEVNFQVGLQGSIIVSQMLAGKQQIGYMGDMPAFVAASKRPTRDLRIVANLGLSRDQCNVMMVRSDAPEFGDQEEALKWMDGKQVATPQGSCTDRYAQDTFREFDVDPASYLNQSIEVIATNFEQGKIDASAIWEPNAARLHNDGIARRVASGNLNDAQDGGFLVMDKKLIDERPDVVEAWLKAELEAQQFLADPANAEEIAQLAVAQTEGFSERDMWDSLFRDWPTEVGGSEDGVRIRQPFVPTGEKNLDRLIERAVKFLFDIDAIPSDQLPEGAIDPSFAEKVLKDEGLTAPHDGEIKALPESEAPAE